MCAHSKIYRKSMSYLRASALFAVVVAASLTLMIGVSGPAWASPDPCAEFAEQAAQLEKRIEAHNRNTPAPDNEAAAAAYHREYLELSAEKSAVLQRISTCVRQNWPKPTQSNCKACADQIEHWIGGAEERITPPGGARVLGPSKNNPGGDWFEHWVVVKDGRVYDGFTGPEGMLTEVYKHQFEYWDVINFGF